MFDIKGLTLAGLTSARDYMDLLLMLASGLGSARTDHAILRL